MESYRFIETLNTFHDAVIHDISLDWYGNNLATCSSDKTVRIYNRKEIDNTW